MSGLAAFALVNIPSKHRNRQRSLHQHRRQHQVNFRFDF
jgi:hypothetical protein